MTAQGKAENFCAHGRKFSYVRKFCPLRTSIFHLPQSAKFLCARKKISFRKKIYFLAEGNLGVFRTEIWASFERKFYALRKAKNFLPQGKKFPHMRKYFFVYTEINFLIYGNKFSYIRKFSSVYTAFFRLAQAGAERGPWKGNFPPRAGRKRRSSLARRWD